MQINKPQVGQIIKSGDFILMESDGGEPYIFHVRSETKVYMSTGGNLSAKVSRMGESWNFVANLENAYLINKKEN